MKVSGTGAYPMNTSRPGYAIRTDLTTFGSMLRDTRQTAQSTIRMYLRNEKTIYSGGTGYQTVYAEYTDDSTPTDPIVRIRGQTASGEYDFTRRINDIDPKNASYAELCALWGHMQKISGSDFQFGGEERPVIPYGVDTGDVTRRQDYMGKISDMTASWMFGEKNQASARGLLDLYQRFLDAKQPDRDQAAQLLSLMCQSSML